MWYAPVILYTSHENFIGHLNAKVGREDIFKSTVGNENLHNIGNDTGAKVTN